MRKSVYGIYARDHDITFVMEEYFTDDGEPVSLEVKGFYFGEPTEIDNETFYGDLKADFSDPGVQENAENHSELTNKITKEIKKMNTIEKRYIVTADNADIYAKIEVRFVVNSETRARRLAAVLSCGFNSVEVVDDCTGEVMFTKYYYWKPRKSPAEVIITVGEMLDNE